MFTPSPESELMLILMLTPNNVHHAQTQKINLYHKIYIDHCISFTLKVGS